MSRTRLTLAIATFLIGAGLSGAGAAQDCTKVEYFAALRADEVNVRTGPGVKYPIDWVFSRQNMPLAVIATIEHWRRVCDWQGTSGWIHRTMLSNQRTVIVNVAETTLRREPSISATTIAHIGTSVVGELDKCADNWCRITVQGYRGWAPMADLWGPVGAP